MSKWIINDECVVDESSSEHIVVRNGEPRSLRPQCWNLLIALIEAQKQSRLLSKDQIGKAVWDDLTWEDTRAGSLKVVLRDLKAVIGEDAIEGKYKLGYAFTKQIREIHSIDINTTEYYELLWNNHHKGFIRDQVATGNVRELIDYYVLPTLANSLGEQIQKPFSEARFHKFIMAGSGYGKSALLDIILLCNVVEDLNKSKSSVLSENSKDRIQKYRDLRASLFGDSSGLYVPVFIHSNKANTHEYVSALDLAEGSEHEDFAGIVQNANHAGRLLFLIDSIDEVESNNVRDYLDALNDMLSDYPNASIVFASRYLGKKKFPFSYDILTIKELNLNDVKRIAASLRPQAVADRLISMTETNRYLLSLARNPFMLTTILETRRDWHVHSLLELVVNAIIDRRWDKHRYNLSDDKVKLLLGFLACKFVFGEKEWVDFSEIRQCFIKAVENLDRYGIPFDAPTQNIEQFLEVLSSQSGILNIVVDEHMEKYLFQDELVMCWLAANYIKEILCKSSTVHQYDGPGGIWANIYWIDGFIRSFSTKDNRLSNLAVHVLVLVIVIISRPMGPDLQKSILNYMICRDATSIDIEEQANIACGYDDLINKRFGENDITNRANSESVKAINRMLVPHLKGTK